MFPDLAGPKPEPPSDDDGMAFQWMDRDALTPTSLNPPRHPACSACAPLFDRHLPMEPLPPTDCFHGQNLGVWFDSFVDDSTGGYFPRVLDPTKTASYEVRQYTLDLFHRWRSIGVTDAIFTGDDDYILTKIKGSLGTIVSDIKNNPFLTYERQWKKDAQGNDVLVYSQFTINAACDVSGLPTPVVVLDEVLEIIKDAFRYKQYARGQAQQGLNSLSEEEVRELFKQYLACLKKEGITVLLSTYEAPRHDGSSDDGDIVMFIRELLTEFDNLVIQPDMYYEFPSQVRFRYWEDLARIVEDRSRIRPFLSTTCIRCSDGSIMQPDCSPANLICDLVHARGLGFGSPYFYISGGIEQRFWEAMILGSWLMGCLPNVPLEQISRPRTYGELQEWLCTLFPITDTGPARSRRMELLKILGFTGGIERVFNNPMSCVPCVRHVENGKVLYCPILVAPEYRCQNRILPCCSNSVRNSSYDEFRQEAWISKSDYEYHVNYMKKGKLPSWWPSEPVHLRCHTMELNNESPQSSDRYPDESHV